MQGGIKILLTSILAVVMVLVMFLMGSLFTPKTKGKEGYYLTFLNEHSDAELHTMWQQLWNLSDKVTVPRSIVNIYGTDTKAADKIIELIASYGFWVDDSETKGQYKYSVDSSRMSISGIKYLANATNMKAQVEFELQKGATRSQVKSLCVA